MDELLLVSDDTPRAARITVAHEEATSLVYLVLCDRDGQPLMLIKLAPESALKVSEDLNIETGKALVRARRRMS